MVVGLDNITGLQTARILARRGVSVIGLAADRRHFGARTNSCTAVIQTDCTGEGLIETLHVLGRRLERPAVLIPCTDSAVSVLSRRREQLGGRFLLPLSDHDVVDLLMDKTRFADHAAAAGLAVPRTEVLSSRVDAQSAAARLRFPCVLKPPVKTPTWLRNTTAKGFPVDDAEEFLSVYDRVSGWSEQLIAQEWVEGSEEALFSCNGYFERDGTPLVTFVARKLRQWPPGAGTSASGAECRNDDILQETIRLFGGVGFHGLAYLEMKRHSRTGEMLIIEPNVGRPTGRSAIAEGGGVELVYTAYCDAAGLPLPAARQQHYGNARWLDLRRDVQAAIVARRRGELTVRDWVRSLRGPTTHAIWSISDPAPFAVDLMHATSTVFRMLGARIVKVVKVTRSVVRECPKTPRRGGMVRS